MKEDVRILGGGGEREGGNGGGFMRKVKEGAEDESAD